jgi:UDP-N-acetylglucosamine:LPS N-acetylglucosamine transferase
MVHSETIAKKSEATPRNRRLKLCIAFSPGGHYVETMQIMEAFGDFDLCFATTYAVTTKDLEKVYFLIDTAERGTIRAMMLNAIVSLKILLKEHPDALITTGAEIVIPLCYLAKLLLGTKIIFIETFARVTAPSFTGRIIYPIADVFLVQWKSLLECYGRKARHIGKVF